MTEPAALHVGLPQTAKTIPRGLARLQASLQEAGVGVFVGRPHHDLAAVVKEESAAVEALTGAPPRRLVGSIEPPWRADDLAGAVVAATEEAASVLGGPVRVFFTTRRQDTLLEAVHLWHRLEGWAPETFDEEFPPAAEPVAAYSDLLDRLAAADGVVEVRARPYELADVSPGHLVHEFLRFAGLAATARPDPELRRLVQADVGVSEKALELARLLHPHLPDEGRRTAALYLHRNLPPPRFRTAHVLSDEQRRRVLAAHDADNRAVFRRWMPDLPEDAYATPDVPPQRLDRRPPRERARYGAETAAFYVRAGTKKALAAIPGKARLPEVPELVLHVGAQKTGTTTIQWAMRGVRRQLREHGLVYLDRRQLVALDHYTRSASFGQLPPPGTLTPYGEEVAGLAVQEWRLAAAAATPERVLASNEAMLGVAHSPDNHVVEPFRPWAVAAVTEVVTALRPERTVVVLYTRRQDRMMESLYMHLVHGGRTTTFEEFLEPALAGPTIRYGDLAERLASVPTVTEVRVRPFEVIGGGAEAFVADFLALVNCPGVNLAPLGPIPRTNVSYSARAMEVALQVNGHLKRHAERRAVRHALGQAFPAPEFPSPKLLDGESRARILDMYAEENRRLFETWMPDLPPDSYASEEASAALAGVL